MGTFKTSQWHPGHVPYLPYPRYATDTDKNLAIYPSILLTLSQDTFLDYNIYLLPGLVHFMSLLHNTHTKTSVLLMCINCNSPFR